MRVVCVCQVEFTARCADDIVRSGDEQGPVLGTRVGESSFNRARVLSFSVLRMDSPLAAARGAPVQENHAGLWALKSPIIKMSSCVEKRLRKFGSYWAGQELSDGI